VGAGATAFDWEAVTALATVASTLVVAVAAIAAVLQIRHQRAANQLEAILRMYERFDGAETVEARRFCADELPPNQPIRACYCSPLFTPKLGRS
jgi:hypothetical protein